MQINSYIISDLEEFKSFVNSNWDDIDIVSFDIETNSVEEIKAQVWGIGLAFEDHEAFYLPLRDQSGLPLLPEKETVEFVTHLLLNKRVIAHNGIYDTLVWFYRYGTRLYNRLYADTILMKHTLDEEPPFGLKEVAVRDLGPWADKAQMAMIDSVKKNGGTVTKTNFEMYKCDTQILGEYCCWDVVLTRKLFDKYQNQLEKENLLKLFYEDEVMPLYREVTIPMKERGIPIDTAYFTNLKAQITEDITKLHKSVTADIEPMVADFEYEYLEKNFPVKRTGNFPKAYASYFGLELPSIAKKVIDSLQVQPEQVELLNFKHWMQGSEDLLGPIGSVQYRMFFDKNPESTSVFNLSSKHHLKWLFFEHLQESPLSTTEKGEPQVDDDFLDSVAHKYAWVKNLQDLNKLEKIKGTYIEGLLDRAHEGIIYTSFLQFGTTSGRFASRNPNLQNQPRPKEDDSGLSPIVLHYNNAIRAGFVAPEGYAFVDSDYSALEPRCVDKFTRVTVDGESKFIKDISIGQSIDTVVGPRKVLNKWFTKKPSVMILTNKGVIKTSPDHKIYSKSRNGWLTANQLTVGEILQTQKTVSKENKETVLPIYGMTKELSKPIGTLTLTNDLAWLLGAFMGDGLSSCVRKVNSSTKKNTTGMTGYIGICGLDEDGVVNKFISVLGEYGYIPTISQDKRSKSGRFSQVTYNSPELLNIFCNTFEVSQLKDPSKKFGSKKLHLPSYLMNASKEIKLAFLAGLLDTDGTVGSRQVGGRDIIFATAVPEFANDICRLLDTLNMESTITYTIKNDKHFGCQVRILKHSSVRLKELGITAMMACKRKSQQINLFEARSAAPPLSECSIRHIFKSEILSDMVDITVEDAEEFVGNGVRIHNCFAHMSGDKNLQDIFHSGTDMYSAIAIRVFGLDNCSAFKKDPNFVGKLHPEKRQIIKALALAVTYGAESFRIADLLKIDPKEAQKLINDYLNAYPNLRKYIDECHRETNTYGKVKTIFGRVRHLKEAKDLFDTYGHSLSDANWARKRGLKDQRRLYKNKLNNSTNFKIQALAGHIINRAMYLINRELNKAGVDGWVCLMVHDQVVVTVAKHQAEQTVAIVQRCMENVVKLDVPLVAEPKIAYNLRDSH